MVALNRDYAAAKTDTDPHEARQRVDGEPKASPKDGLKRVPEIGQFEPQNRVGGFFSLAAQSVGVDRCSSRNRIGENRVYAYETASVDTEYEYSPFGEVVRSSGTYADATPFRFSTKYLDTETGLYYYGYRHYDPATGRWLNRDPLQERGGLNLYGFVLNVAINAYDYLGLDTRIQIGYTNTPVPGTNHALVIATDTQTGEQFASRAGPSAQGPSGSASESSQSSSGGSASASSGNGSSGGFGFGTIDAQSRPYNEDFRDPPSAVHTVQDVGTIDRDFSDVVNNMQEFESVTDSNQIPYSPLGPNSNSYAFTLAESLTGERPEPDVTAPGWKDGRPDGNLSYAPSSNGGGGSSSSGRSSGGGSKSWWERFSDPSNYDPSKNPFRDPPSCN